MAWLADTDGRSSSSRRPALLETFLRGTLTDLALFPLLRVVLKRQRGGVA